MLPQRPADADSSIRLTDNDAAVARLSAVQKNYLSDPFIKALVPRAHLQPPRPPLINIGTYVRTVAIDDLVDQWIQIASQEGKTCQITGPQREDISAYIEVDFSENTTKKAMAIRKSKELSAVLGQDTKLALGGTALHSAVYHLVPADLREPPAIALSSLIATLEGSSKPPLDTSLPTLLIFECVLVYMSPESSTSLVQWFSEHFARQTALGAIVYEMFGLEDSFGRVMVNNLKARNVTLPGAAPYPTLASLPSRFLSLDFTAAHALTLRDIRKTYIDPGELDRIAQLEFLDEIEELDLVLQHYAITWGLSVPSTTKSMSSWFQWGLKKKQRTEADDSF
ncbi:carboxy methyl transferase for protein phosphatase 2A [Marasmius crinis-equi]|uniref:Leucine carboxyl methyltransferase 1 n=1 Tax=Marasmius crinis-equi TaxID=585013 RepID=A0ABR3FTU8_9AGAR